MIPWRTGTTIFCLYFLLVLTLRGHVFDLVIEYYFQSYNHMIQ